MVILFMLMAAVVVLYGCSVKKSTESSMDVLLEKRRDAAELVAFFSELSGEEVEPDTTWSDMYYDSVYGGAK